MKNQETSPFPIVIIGAGPVGLAAAAHLVARGLEPLILEAGAEIAASVRSWGHVQLFSPWSFNVDRAAADLLEAQGWSAPADDTHPTGRELVEHYLEPLAATPELAGRVRLGHRVIGVSRQGLDRLKSTDRASRPFVVTAEKSTGEVERILARAVIDASGTWQKKSPAGGDGLPADGETTAPIFSGIPDLLGVARSRYSGRHVAVIGAGHSAMNALLDLVSLRSQNPKTEILWILRGASPRYGGGRNDALAARGELGGRLESAVAHGEIRLMTDFHVEAFCRSDDGKSLIVGRRLGVFEASAKVDEVIVATGLRPDFGFLGELRLELDPIVEAPSALAPLIDPNVHSCGSVPPHGERELRHALEPGFYLVGMKSYGRAPTFLLLTGYEQVRSIAAFLAGDLSAATEVQLVLPETGVCHLDRAPRSATGCCEPSQGLPGLCTAQP